MKIHRKLFDMTKTTMEDRTPYLYLVGWSKENVWYIGRQTGVNCHPGNLWVSYFTSSKYVKSFRDEHGEPNIIECRWVFDSIEECCASEDRLLERLKIGFDNKLFLNKKPGRKWHNHGATFNMPKNKANAILKETGERLGKISTEDQRWKTGEVVGHSFGLTFPPDEKRNKKISYALSGKKKTKEHRDKMSKSKKGTVVVFDKISNKNVTIRKDEFICNDRFVGITHGMVNVRDTETGSILQINKQDPRYMSGELKHMSTGMIAAKITETGEHIGVVSRDDPRWEDGLICHVQKGITSPLKGTSTAKKGIKTGRCCAKYTQTGEIIGMVSLDDERWEFDIITPAKSVIVVIDGVRFGSLKKAAAFYSVDQQTLKNYIKKGKSSRTPPQIRNTNASFCFE
jgi:hypothetical protein